MFQIFSSHHLKKPLYTPIYSIITRILIYPTKTHFSTAPLIKNHKSPSSSESNHTQIDSSSLKLSGIAKNVISKCSHTNKGEIFTTLSLKDYIFTLSLISPEVIRRFWRVDVLKPQDVYEILLGFEYNRGGYEVEVKKVESLWAIFKWASGQNGDFVHLPQSCKIMASLLVQVGRFREAESLLLSRRESQGILLDCEGIFSDLIEGYLGDFELDKGLYVYERMRRLGLVPSMSGFRALIEYLVELNETQLMYRVYVDMIEMGVGKTAEEKEIHEDVIRLLCVDGRVQEARDVVKRILKYGIIPSGLVVNAISSGYCDKKDYNDLLSFFVEAKIAPDVVLGNKILFSMCGNFGVEQAEMFLHKLEGLSFCPEEITFAILIGFSCREGKLKNSLFYISNILSRGLKPHVCSYNALLSGMFQEGMWMHTRDVLVEMNDKGVSPDMSTYRVLLAGFCKARQFDEVKAIVGEMADRDLIKLSPLEDILTKGFNILGLSSSTVKIKRDNDKGIPKAEFFDNLGNGLYLETDLYEYESKITRVLEDAMIPDFNSSIIEEIQSRDIKSTQIIVDEMSKWGQELSLPALSSLLNRLSKVPFSVETINHLLVVMSKSTYQLDHTTLNMLVRTYSKRGFTFKARTLFDGMVRRGYTIDNGTYSAILCDICKKGDLRSFHYFYKLARKYNWFPEAKDNIALLGYICKNKWLNEAFELFETIISVSPNDIFGFFHSFLEGLCSQGFTSIARDLLEEFSNAETVLNHTVYSCVVNGFCREKNFTGGLKVLETMLSRNLYPPLDISTKMISQLCMIDFEKAVELKNICLRDQSYSPLPINCALINGLCKSGRIENAASLFMEVVLEGLVLNIEVYNALIEGYCRENNLRKVKELLGVMIRKNLSISISGYSKMVRLTCTKGKSSFALSLKEIMLLQGNCHPELVLYNILIFHISSMRKVFLLDEIIHALHEKGLNFDDVTYNFVIRGFLRCNDTSRSLHYLRTMISQDFQPSNRTLRKVIACLCENGELGLVFDLSREMELRGWIFGSVVQNNIIDALLNNNKLIEAVEFLDKLSSKDLIPNHVNYDYLIKRFYHHGRLDKAVDLLNIMLEKGSNPESTSYDYIIQGLCDSYKWDIALDVYTEMMYRDLKPSLITWEILVRGLSECGRLEGADKMLRSMIEIGENPRREVFESLINKYRSDKNISKASEVLKVMQEKGYVPDFDTHWSLISNLSDSGKKDGGDKNSGFLSSLLSGFGFARKKNDSKVG